MQDLSVDDFSDGNTVLAQLCGCLPHVESTYELLDAELVPAGDGISTQAKAWQYMSLFQTYSVETNCFVRQEKTLIRRLTNLRVESYHHN